jgi:hypothetical protein
MPSLEDIELELNIAPPSTPQSLESVPKNNGWQRTSKPLNTDLWKERDPWQKTTQHIMKPYERPQQIIKPYES